MKKTTIVLLCSAVIVIFTVLVAVVCFKLYYQDDGKRLDSIEVSLNDKGKGISLDSAIPIEDDKVEELKGYDFQVKNKGNVDSKYQVLIEEVELSNKKGYSKSELLSRNQLNYELSLNGEVINGGSMADIHDNIIDERIIPVSKTNKYKLKVWMPVGTLKTNWSNKYYRYKVNIQSVTEEIK